MHRPILGASRPERSVAQAMWRGARGRCPHCGQGRLFGSFLKTVDRCQRCGETISHHRADDLPAYLVIFVVGHVVVGAFMSVQAVLELSTWTHLAIWAPATVIASIMLIGPAKGSIVGLQWALYMHGFGGEVDALDSHSEL
jgi:uncharacterized protein (DUF983 family)